MTQPGCHGPDCTYTGPGSGAAPGRCTQTNGYISNFEIREILATKSDVQQYSDKHGDVLVYDGVQWVSWMSRGLYDERANWIKGLNFGGTSDWAIDLDADYNVGDGPGGGDSGSGPVIVSPDIYKEPNPLATCYPPCTFVWPPWVLSTTTTISMPPVTVTYEENWVTTVTIDNSVVITTSAASITSTVITVPPVTTTAIDVWNVVWNDEDHDKDDVVWLTSSVTFPPISLTQTVRSDVTRPPITWTYSPGPYPTPNPGPPGPPGPPPPPPGFPSTIRVTGGAPKPTCKPGQVCGKPCLLNCNPRDSGCFGICGCIGPFCPAGSCAGPGCGSGGGGGGGGNGEPTSCRTSATASFCKVDCSVYHFPQSTSTTCRNPSCSRTTTACRATGSTTTATTTMSCPSLQPYVGLGPNEQVPILGDGGLGGIVVDPGDFTSVKPPPQTSSTPTKRPSTQLPVPTGSPPDGGPYCFRNHNEDLRWNFFTDTAGNDLLNTLCDVADELSPSNTFGHAIRGRNGLLASVTWATSQTGCKPKAPLPLRDYCRDSFRYIVYSCDNNNRDQSYGGAYIDDDVYGCVRWWLGAELSPMLRERKPPTMTDAVMNTTVVVEDAPKELKPAQQAKLLDLLDELEVELPRLDREKVEGFRRGHL
jgi:chitinase